MISFKKWMEGYDAQLYNYFVPSDNLPNDPRGLLKQLQVLKGQQDREDYLGSPYDAKSPRGEFGRSRIQSPQDWGVSQDIVKATEILNNKNKHSIEDIEKAQNIMDVENKKRQQLAKDFKPSSANQGSQLSDDARLYVDRLIKNLKNNPSPEEFQKIRADYQSFLKHYFN